MEEPVYAAPANDATGAALPPPPAAASRRRDQAPPARPRRAETSAFAPPGEAFGTPEAFSMTTPIDEPAAPQLHAVEPIASVYDIPRSDAAAPGAWDLPVTPPPPIDIPAPRQSTVYDIPRADTPPPMFEPPSLSSERESSAPPAQVYDLTGTVLPTPAADADLLATAPPPAAAFRVPAFDPPSADDVFDIDLSPADGEPSGDLLAALREVLFRGASDLHISAGAPPMLRIDGALGPIGDGKPWSREVVKATLMGLLSPYERERFEQTLELDFAYTLTANARFRVNYYQDRGSMSAAFRIIPNEVKQLAQLGIPEPVAQFATLPRGLVLVTGPTGSGKSTTLAALIDIVNSTRTDHIMTVEDPIEFLHRNKKSLVHQREVGRDTLSFSSALKHVLRQDPDVILIGELRDLETISTALTAAETGHLVFATLHTQDAAQTIDRIIDVYPPHQQMQIRSQLASTLQGIVCQTLVKRASGAGRVVAAEVLMMTPAIGNLIREGKTFQISSAMQSGRALGMSTLDQHLADLVNSGAITRQSAIDKARDIAAMTRMITRVDVSDHSNDGSFGSFSAPNQTGIN